MESPRPDRPASLTIAQAKARLHEAADACDLGKIISRNPLLSLAAAAALGFATGPLHNPRGPAAKALLAGLRGLVSG